MVFVIKAEKDIVEDPPSGADRSIHDLCRIVDRKVLGQIADYVSRVLARQYRTFCYSIFVFGRKLRFMRWDRAGCIVTEAFDYLKESHHLEFFWRLSHASLEQRGIDTSCRDASEEEASLLSHALRDHIQLQLSPDNSVARGLHEKHFKNDRVSVLYVFDAKTKERQEHVVSNPLVFPENVNGRGTRGFWAYSLKEHRITFLKDSWPVVDSELNSEGENYNDLGTIPHVPKVLGYNDFSEDSCEL